MMAETLQVQLECHTLPAPGAEQPGWRRLGVQEGKDVVEDKAIEGQAEIHFRLPIQVELAQGGEAAVYRGKYVHGPRSDPFLYLCWGDRPAGTWEPNGRSKIPLRAIPLELVRRALREGGVLRARIHLTGKNGGPAFASLKEDRVEWLNG